MKHAMPLNPRIENWAGQVVWLVGASSGIGRATAKLLHDKGALVIVSARNAKALAGFVAAHPGSQALALDVGDAQALRDAAQRIVELHGRIDVAVYCAGYYKPMRATDFDLPDALRHEQVNYVGALHLLDAVLPVLLRQGSGHLSLVSSVRATAACPRRWPTGRPRRR